MANIANKKLLMILVATAFTGIVGLNNTSNLFAEGGRPSQVATDSPSKDCLDACAQEQALPPSVFKNMNQLVYSIGGRTVTVDGAENFLFQKDGRARLRWKNISQLYRKRSPKTQYLINQKLTEQLGIYGMSFKAKDESSHKYDRVFIPPVNGVVIPLAMEDFKTLASSTGPVLRAMSTIDSIFFSSTNKERDFTAESMMKKFKSDCSKEQIQEMISAINKSIYDIPALHGEEMSKYPFIAVAGVDAMISDPEHMDYTFAEFNLGTPSGISNQRYNLYNLFNGGDPELAKALLPRLSQDRTFEYLRKTIEKNALLWTKNPNGISVIVGAGEGNAAHPDISSISYFSGMPLVRKKDLYIDGEGNVRLKVNANDPSEDPVVTGVYSREEESFFLSDDEIPLIDPSLDQKKMTQIEIDVKLPPGSLKPGNVYKWIFEKDKNENATEKIIGVERDDLGRPLLASTYDSLADDPLADDPTITKKNRGNLANAIKKGKLYTNVVGGRIMDDKKVFEVISKCFAHLKQFTREGEFIASPPRSYSNSELAETIFKATPEELAKYVVKKPNDSGGVGVHILVNYSPEERIRIVEELRKHPEGMVVQDFVTVGTLTVPVKNKNDEYSYRTHAGQDLRIFIFQDGEGNISYDWMGILSREAKATVEEDGEGGDPRSNTSAGGGMEPMWRWLMRGKIQTRSILKVYFKGNLKSTYHYQSAMIC